MKTTRRQFLRVVAIGSASALAGCGPRPPGFPADGGANGPDGGRGDGGFGPDGGTNGIDGGVDGGPSADAGTDGGAADAGTVVPPEAITESPFLFTFGIAAGDALDDRVVLHTRYSGLDALSLKVWRMEGEAYAELVADAPVTPGDGGFVHLDVQGLTPGTRYRYAFVHGGANGRSPVGKFRAALATGAVEPLIFGAVCCTSNDKTPTPLARAAERTDLDAFLLLGDTTYNDGADTLAEYRAKWAQSLSRPEYRALRQSVGLYATWDDHEVTNDFNPETISQTKLATARKAYFESLPLRRHATEPDRIWKSVRWGSTAELFVLDGRGERKPSTILSQDPIYLSRAQLDWFKAALKASPATFKIVMNSVPISDFGFSAFNVDSWRAYQKQRLEILSWVEDEQIPGVLWISGDHHFASFGTVSATGAGASAIEVLCGPGAQTASGLSNLLAKPRFPYASGDNNYLAIHCLPATKEYKIVFHDGAGTALFTKTFAT